ncbi:MAG: P-type conjugative transfer protein TrbL [Proteobacteria bacterium]|nr:MAG: P-type conjugative transfer protein TrbL [Pseudomonadota bacterium]
MEKITEPLQIMIGGHMKKLVIIVTLFIVLVLFESEAFAQAATASHNHDNILDGIVDLYRNAAIVWGQALKAYALRLFWTLAGISLAWSGGKLLLKQAEMQEVTATLIRWCIFTGLYLALIQNSGEWPLAIVNSFRTIAGEISTTIPLKSNVLTPSNLFDDVMVIANEVTQQSAGYDVVSYFLRIFCAFIMLLIYAYIAAILVTALVEMYITLNAGVLLLAFGGLELTRDIPTSYFRHTIAVGVKLFTLQLLTSLGGNFVKNMLGDLSDRTVQDVIAYCCVGIVLAVLVKTVPEQMSRLVGSSTGGGSMDSATNGFKNLAQSPAWSATKMGLKTAGGAVAMGVGVGAAASLAKAQGSKGLLGTSKATAGNFLGGLARDIGGKITGAHQLGSSGTRIKNALTAERQNLQTRGQEQSASKSTDGANADTGGAIPETTNDKDPSIKASTGSTHQSNNENEASIKASSSAAGESHSKRSLDNNSTGGNSNYSNSGITKEPNTTGVQKSGSGENSKSESAKQKTNPNVSPSNRPQSTETKSTKPSGAGANSFTARSVNGETKEQPSKGSNANPVSNPPYRQGQQNSSKDNQSNIGKQSSLQGLRSMMSPSSLKGAIFTPIDQSTSKSRLLKPLK